MQNTRPYEFIALVAFLTALMAMSIDTMLPAMGQMASELGANHPNDRQLIIIGFFAGSMLGIPVFGPLSDSIGRKPSIFASLIVFTIGALLCVAAQSYAMLVLGRIIQGFGASGPRIVAMAMVRDGNKGADMARIMSFVMSVFMLVPIIAPSVGTLVLRYSDWRWIFIGLIVAGIILGLWVWLRQPETLHPDNRKPFAAAELWFGLREVVRNRVTLFYTIANGLVFAAVTAYLSVCQQLWAEQYAQGDYFALWFGGFGAVVALAMIVNGKLVKSVGMRPISRLGLVAHLAVWVVLLGVCLVYAGHPPLLLMAALFAVWFFCAGFTFGNFNAMAMEPMGHIAGMAAAVTGTISQGLAIACGGTAARFYDGTLTPLALSFVLFSGLALIFVEWAEAGRRNILA
jgi:MFS transporter, DHA1 family, multidrug resistance protein